MLKERCEQCAGSGVAYAVIPKETVVNQALTSLHGGSLYIRIIVP